MALTLSEADAVNAAAKAGGLSSGSKAIADAGGILGGASTSSRLGTPGTTPGADPGVQDFLKSNYDPYAQTIMGKFASAQKAASAGASSQAKAIQDTGEFNLGYQSTMDKAQGTQMLESGRGFAVNPGAIKILQDSSTKRIRDLTTQMNDALANNQTQLANSLANLQLQEQTALTNARTTFLSQYFQGKQEQRAAQSFQTPEQQAVMQLGTTYPSAGIVAGDSLADAQRKAAATPQYQLGIQTQQAGVQLAGAQASQAGAAAGLSSTQAGLTASQTQQQNIINRFMKGDTAQFSSDIQGLKNGTLSLDNLHAKYDGFPGGAGAAIIASIMSQAQAQGYQPFQAGLGQSAQQQNALNLGSGGYTGLSTGATNVLNDFLGKGLGATPLSTPAQNLSPLVSPAKGQTTTLNGVNYVFDGTKWNPK